MKYKNFETLRKNEDFQRVYKGKKAKADSFLVVYVLGNDCGTNRLGISASKKIGNSVVRHRLTRLVREAFRINSESIKKGFDVVAVVREPFKGKDYAAAEKSLIRLLKKHDIIIDKNFNEQLRS